MDSLKARARSIVDRAENPPRPTLGRPRRRSVEAAILDAAVSLLDERGYAAMTIDDVAARAGVGKQTIYRRWSSKAAVVLDGFTARAETEIAAPDTGSVREDVRLLLSRAFAALRSGRGHVVTVLMAEAQLNQEFASVFRDAFISRRRQVLIDLLARGIARGQLRRGTDLELLADLLYGPMWYRLLNRHAVLDDAFAQTLTDAVLGTPE